MPILLRKIEKYKENRKGSKKGENGNRKGKKGGGNSKNKGIGKNAGANVRFPGIGGDCPRSTAISTDQMETVSDENGVSSPEREVLISQTI